MARPRPREAASDAHAEWPAGQGAMNDAVRFLSSADDRIVLACDRDADGLGAAVLLERALVRRGQEVTIVPARRGEHVHGPAMQARIAAARPRRLVALDMGSRSGAILAGTPTLLIDHHQPRGLPDAAIVLGAFGHEPVATTSVLAWELARRLGPADDLGWLALLGAIGDGAPTFPGLAAMRVGRAAVTEAVALVNAARRAPDDAVEVALAVLRGAPDAGSIARGTVPGVDELRRCRAEVQAEVQRWARTPPRVDGKLAVIRVSSRAQIHPLLAARWVGRLRATVVLVANDAFLPGRVNFAMRTRLPVNLVDLLRSVPLDGACGDWGHGHPAASGGSLPPADFERLLTGLRAALPAGPTKQKRRAPSPEPGVLR